MANTFDASLFVCDKTGWTVVPIATCRPIVTSRGTFVQWWCPACDTEGHTRQHAEYNPAHPAVHVTSVGAVEHKELWPSGWTANGAPL